MRVSPATPETLRLAAALSTRFAKLPPHIAADFARTGYAALRLKGGRFDISASLVPEVVQLLGVIRSEGSIAAPPIYLYADGLWKYVPCVERGVPTQLIILDASNVKIEYMTTNAKVEADEDPAVKSWYHFTKKNLLRSAVHEAIEKMQSCAEPSAVFLVAPEKRAPGTVISMRPGTIFRITHLGDTSSPSPAPHPHPVALGVWSRTGAKAKSLQKTWESLLSPPTEAGIVDGPNFMLWPKDAHGFGSWPVPEWIAELKKDVDPFPQRLECFPLAPLDMLHWRQAPHTPAPTLAPTPAPAAPVPVIPAAPEPHAGLASLLHALKTKWCPTDEQRALLRDAEQLDAVAPDGTKLAALEYRLGRLAERQYPLSQEAYLILMATIKAELLKTKRNKEQATIKLRERFDAEYGALRKVVQAEKSVPEWDSDYRTRWLWETWKRGERAAQEAEEVVLDDHDPDDGPKSAAATADKLKFVSFDRCIKCKRCGSKEVIYANCESKECFYAGMRERCQLITERDAELGAAISAQLTACQSLPLPPENQRDGRSIPAAFRDPLQKVYSATLSAERKLGIAGAASESAESPAAAATATRGIKRQRKSKAQQAGDEDEDEDDDDDEDDDEDGDGEDIGGDEEEEEEEEDDDEEDFDSKECSSSSSRDMSEEEDGVMVPKLTALRNEASALILDFKRDLPMPDEVDDLEQLWYKGGESSFIGVRAKVAMLREAPSVFGLRRSPADVWPQLYRRREMAELKASQLNVHVAAGHNAYQVFERPVKQAEEVAPQ